MAADVPSTRLVYVADRESDIVELMQCAQNLGTPADWLVRAKHNRCLPEEQKLWSHTCAGEPLGEIVFTMPSRQGQKARPVRQQHWARHLEIPAGKTAMVELTCIVACEVGAPAGITPVQWRLLTNRVAPTLEMRTGRTCPDLDAALFFNPDEIRAAFLLTKKKPPKRPPRINEVLRLIATLGGFLARKGDGEPRVKTIWLGLQRVRDAATTLQALRDESL